MSIQLTVVVLSVYPGPLEGAVFSGRDDAGSTHRFVADSRQIFRSPVVGETWTLEGEVELHPKYGRQIRVENALVNKPSGKLIINYLVCNPAFDGIGIGRKKAERLWDAFGEELYSILSASDVNKLSLILTEETARKLADAWQESAGETEVIRFLSHHGFDAGLAKKIRRVWPEAPIQKLQDNPYRMLAFAGWHKVDAAAQALGVARDDTRRQIAAVESFLYDQLDAKHTVTPRDTVVGGVAALLRTGGRTGAEAAVEQAVGEQAVIPFGDGLQPFGAAVMEKYIANRFRSMLSLGENVQPGLFSTCMDAVISESVRRFEGDYGIRLTAEQKAAAGMALALPLSVITGGAGVGKTTVLRLIHEACERTGTNVIQVALSGRAAHRMREATGREASTIAKYLKLTDAHNVEPQAETLMIVDEASMLDLPLTYSIVRTLPAGARLLLVGDPYQLPPIGFGLLLHVLVDSPAIPKVELSQVHRQADSTGIPQIAHAIRRGQIPRLEPFGGVTSGVFFVEAHPEDIPDSLELVMAQMKNHDDVQILGVTKRDVGGVTNINTMFHAIHSDGKAGMREFVEGEPVIHTVNDYKNELWNGSLGEIIKVVVRREGNGSRALLCEFEGRQLELKGEQVDRLDLAYAITVHKAQGSQFRRVVIPIKKNRLLDRTLIYTALTRGVDQVVFIGDRKAFNNSIQAAPRSRERLVGLTI